MEVVGGACAVSKRQVVYCMYAYCQAKVAQEDQ